MIALEKNLNALIAVILGCILLGAFGVQIFMHETPCPLCFLQRLGMLGVGIGALMNIKFGIRTAHYGLSILSAFTGGFVSVRQISLHICPQFTEFGTPFWGLNLYTWAFIVFLCSTVAIALLLLIFDKRAIPTPETKVNGFGIFAMVFLFLIALANVGATLYQCGLGPCPE